MSTVHAIANVSHALMALKEKIPPNQWSETPLPVIVAPGWWMNQVRTDLGGDPELELAEVHGCAVIRRDELTEPMLLDHDGRMYAILPQWMRAKQAADTEGGEA